MGWLGRRLSAANPYASNLSTAEREKAARKEQRAAAGRRAAARVVLRGGGKKPRWHW